MKIAISAASPDLDSTTDTRFGRAACFVIVDADTMEWQAYPNPGLRTGGGAGTQAAQFVARQGIQVAVSGDFGPNACSALQAAGIAMYLLGASRTVREAIEHFKSGSLMPLDVPSSMGNRRR